MIKEPRLFAFGHLMDEFLAVGGPVLIQILDCAQVDLIGIFALFLTFRAMHIVMGDRKDSCENGQ